MDRRELTDHHDGHGLNDSIAIYADDRDANAGGASHEYECFIGAEQVANIQFQHGARHEPTSTAGITEAVLLSILIDRLRDFQAGPFACRENAIQITHLEETLHWTRARADARAKRGVLGKNIK